MDLVPNRWYAILDVRDVPSGKPVGFERMGRSLVLWRDQQGAVHCADDRCPHRGASLSTGKLHGDTLQCRYHGFCFDKSGACTTIPAHPTMRIPSRMSVRTHIVRQAHDFIWFWNGPPEDATDDIPFFDFDGFVYDGSRMTRTWPTHYAHVVENELDWAHLPFVHHNTIGSGMDQEMAVEVHVEGDTIRAWSQKLGPKAFVELIGPNVWRLKLNENTFNFFAFAPVNDESVVLYGRTYQQMITWKPLSWVVGKVWALTNPFVLAQDYATVTSQRPIVPAIEQNVFVPSDKPILEYFRWRQRLKRTSKDTERMAGK